MEENGDVTSGIDPAVLEAVAWFKRALVKRPGIWWDNPDSSSLSIQHDDSFQNPRTLNIPSTEFILVLLEENPQINSMEIYNFRINDDAVWAMFCDRLPSTSVRKLDFHCMLGNEDLRKLVPACRNVTSLDISGNQRIEGARGGQILRDYVSFNTVLETLKVSGNKNLGPSGALTLGQGLARNDRLQCVEMQGCCIGNNGLENLVRGARETNLINTTMTRLDLGKNDISDFNGGAYVGLLLQQFTALQDLGLVFNRIGWLGLGVHLKAKNLVLTKLDLSCCNMRNLGVLKLLPVGNTNESVTNLNLSCNGIQGAVGGENLGNVLGRFTNVQTLKLSGNHLGSDGFQRLVLALQGRHFACVDLSYCNIGNQGNLHPRGDARMSVADLHIRCDRFFGGTVRDVDILTVDVLPYFTNVDKLSLYGLDRTSNEGVRGLVTYLQQQHWKHVSVKSCNLADDVHIQTLTDGIRISDNVESLDLRYNDGIYTVSGLESVKNMLWRCKHMDKLEISFSRDPEQVQVLVDCLCGDMTNHMTLLRELIVHFALNDSREDYEDYLEEWIQDLLLRGFEKNSSLHLLKGAWLSLENELQVESFLLRNRLITYAKSLDKVALAASRLAVVDALWEPSQEEEGTNASWMIIQSVVFSSHPPLTAQTSDPPNHRYTTSHFPRVY